MWLLIRMEFRYKHRFLFSKQRETPQQSSCKHIQPEMGMISPPTPHPPSVCVFFPVLGCSQVHQKLLWLITKESASSSSNPEFFMLLSNGAANGFAMWACSGLCKSRSQHSRFLGAIFDLAIWGTRSGVFIRGRVRWFLPELAFPEPLLRTSSSIGI